jgi:hypothetical protein
MRLLEILIPSVPERSDQLQLLTERLMLQINEQNIAISTFVTEPFIKGGLTTGLKRQNLIEGANSEYVVFVDDDDFVSDDYISEIVKALEYKPDIVTFNVAMPKK